MKKLFLISFVTVLLSACNPAEKQGAATYTNPILGGDYPDPTIVRVDSDYYMTHSSFNYQPGLAVLHSRDLVHWQPISCALTTYLGSVWAPDISYHDNRYWIYFTVDTIGKPYATWMVQAEHPEGPWSQPVRLETGGSIDPCFVEDVETGKRWLYLSGGRRIALSDDGTYAVGDVEHVYDGWPIPNDWIYEGFALEGPKVKHVGDYYYWLNAQGGTAGPPTAHMEVVARSKSLDGPWENAPCNPLVHTYSRKETWWCRGHASLIDTPSGDWWLVSHAYEKNYVGLGRQTILEPIVWNNEGWPVAPTGAASDQPISCPPGSDITSERRLQDWNIGTDWRFYKQYDPQRIVNNSNGSLTLHGHGTSPADASPLLMIAGCHDYELQLKAELQGDVSVGLVGFYNERFYAGIGYDTKSRFSWRRGTVRARSMMEGPSTIWLRLRNEEQILTGYYSTDGKDWEKQTWGYEISGYNHNTAGEFQSLLPGIVVIGQGQATLKDFSFKKLDL